jgi:hypothetical protein
MRVGNVGSSKELIFQLLCHPVPARKRYTDLKRSLKRSLSDALEHDDVTDFGYDKVPIL